MTYALCTRLWACAGWPCVTRGRACCPSRMVALLQFLLCLRARCTACNVLLHSCVLEARGGLMFMPALTVICSAQSAHSARLHRLPKDYRSVWPAPCGTHQGRERLEAEATGRSKRLRLGLGPESPLKGQHCRFCAFEWCCPGGAMRMTLCLRWARPLAHGS